jgi:rSAM/selenodomain-associated transferase 1
MKDALLIFARRPAPGKVKTRLIPRLSPHEAAQLYQYMLTDILNKTASIREVDKILFYEGGREADDYFRTQVPRFRLCPQRGEDLGVRMEAAFDHAFTMGYRSAAVIGTDSPDLPVAYIEESFRMLENGDTDVVFGPAEDGGYYLLGMKRTHGELFRGITWSSGKVLRESIGKAGLLGLSCKILPVWYDVDVPADLKRPELKDPANCAPLTRHFIEGLGISGQNNAKYVKGETG